MDRDRDRRRSPSPSEQLVRDAKEQLGFAGRGVESQLEEARRMLDEQAAMSRTRARRAVEDLEQELEGIQDQPSVSTLVAQMDRTAAARRPTRPARPPVAAPPPDLVTEPRGSAAGMIAGGVVAVLVVALALGVLVAVRSAEDPGAVTPQVSVATMTEAVRQDGFFLESGIEDPGGEIAAAVARASSAGIGFAAVVLVDDRDEGPYEIAARIEPEVDAGTVLVLSATMAGMSSSAFDDAVVEAAMDAGSVAFSEGGGDPGYVAAAVEVLIESR